MGVAEKTLDETAIMAVLETVPDPEIPVLYYLTERRRAPSR